MAVWLNFWWKIGYTATEQLQATKESICFIKKRRKKKLGNSRVKRNLIVSLKKEEEKMETSLVGENGL